MSKINRRRFIKNTAMISLGLSTMVYPQDKQSSQNKIINEKEYLKEILYTRREVDDWLANKAFPFSKYHSEFGWLLNNAHFRDGIDNSMSTYTYIGDDGERLMSNYKEKTCRINTYGNSYTQCHQVSDHETWQEVLAAHLQEPVRNFGIGGWSLYQAYLRMLKEEQRSPAEYIIFNIYHDDHRRNLDAWRNIHARKHPQHIEAPLPYVKVNLKEEKIEECPNPCPTPESLYDLCDLEKAWELFKDDFVLKIMVAHRNAGTKNPYQSYSDIMSLALTHGINTEIENSETLSAVAERLHQRAAVFSSEKIIEKIELYAKKNNKKVLYVLSYPAYCFAQYVNEEKRWNDHLKKQLTSSRKLKYVKGGHRWDQPFVDFMISKNLPFVDLIECHKKDFQNYNLDIKTYSEKYWVGHYNPAGNHFCAFVIKNKLVEMMDPKPFPYL